MSRSLSHPILVAPIIHWSYRLSEIYPFGCSIWPAGSFCYIFILYIFLVLPKILHRNPVEVLVNKTWPYQVCHSHSLAVKVCSDHFSFLLDLLYGLYYVILVSPPCFYLALTHHLPLPASVVSYLPNSDVFKVEVFQILLQSGVLQIRRFCTLFLVLETLLTHFDKIIQLYAFGPAGLGDL